MCKFLVSWNVVGRSTLERMEEDIALQKHLRKHHSLVQAYLEASKGTAARYGRWGESVNQLGTAEPTYRITQTTASNTAMVEHAGDCDDCNEV